MVTDPIADLLTRVRNAAMARHDSVMVPASKMKIAVAKILKDEGFIADFSIVKGEPQRMIKITLKYIDKQPAFIGLERVSKPGLRVYCRKEGDTQSLRRPRHRYHFDFQGTDDRSGSMEEEPWRRSIMLCMVIELSEVNLCLV